jgi:thioredoxin-dependent peroxiredoxin
MALKIGSTAPDFEAETTQGTIHFHEWIGDSWAVLFSHPRNFTPVCTTELGYLAGIEPEFAKRGVKVIGLSVDPVENHAKWSEDILETQGHAVNYPLIGDKDFAVAKAYGMLPAEVEGDPTTRTPADNATVRNVFVIGPDKKIKLILIYPMTTGRNFDEVLRVIDSLQLTANHKVATPAQWQPGDDVIIAGSVSNDEATEKYPDGWETPRPYIRIVKQPGYDQPAAETPAVAEAPAPPAEDAAPPKKPRARKPKKPAVTADEVLAPPADEPPAPQAEAAADEAPAPPADEPAPPPEATAATNGHADHDHTGHAHAGDADAGPAGPSAPTTAETVERVARQVIEAATPVVKRIAEYIKNARNK